MKSLKKYLAVAMIAAVACSTAKISADECAPTDCATVAGCGYQECCSSPCLTPAIALGAIAVVAIVAVALQNSNPGHSHSHSHHD